MLVPPKRLRAEGLVPILRNISSERIRGMQQYLERVVRPAVLFDYRGRAPDAFSAFLDELIHLSRTKLPRLDKAKLGGGGKPAGRRGGKRGGAGARGSGAG